MTTNQYFEEGVTEAIQQAQLKANQLGRSIKVEGRWVNPSSAALARRNKPSTDVHNRLKEEFNGNS
jgi:hypothetical protein